MNLTWNDRKAKVAEMFFSFSIKDVTTSLLCSHLWLPNIASPIKHLFLYSILASLKPTKFQRENKIRQYEDFVNFLENIYSFIPSFPLLEDYIPEMDWGEVKFPHDGTNYKIFYGSELENVYDYLALFQIIYIPLDKEYSQQTDRFPSKELNFCLKLQDYFISGIKQNVDKKKLDVVELGGIEVPEKEFWKSVNFFIDTFDPQRLAEETNLLEIYSINLGEYNLFKEDEQSFGEMFLSGMALPYYFLKVNEKYYPLMPRRFPAILIDNWATLFYANKDKISKDKFPYSLRCGGALHKYIKGRCNVEHIFPLVSTVDKDNRPHSLIYNTSLIVEDKLLLVYLMEPSADISEELQKVKKELKKSLQLLQNQPTTLALHMERKNVSFAQHSGEAQLEPYPITIIPDISVQLGIIDIPIDMPGRVLPLNNFLALVDEMENIQELVEFFEYLDSDNRIISSFTSILDKFGAYRDSAGVLIEGAREPNWIMLDPHWGSNLRYTSLKKFWEVYPPVNFFNHPRTWKVGQETSTRVRFEARGYLGAAIYTAIGNSHIFCNAPFREMNFNQGQLANLLMECLEDSISTVKEIIKDLAFFTWYEQFQVLFFPYALVKSSDSLKHLRHLDPKGNLWTSDTGFVQKGIPGVRIVFNDKKVQESFAKAKNNSVEIKLLLEFLEKINSLYYDRNITEIKKSIVRKLRGRKPRFKMFLVNMDVSFPEFTSSYIPDIKHVKLARKQVAQIAKSIGINPGEYDLSQAKDCLDKLRIKLVDRINKEVQSFNFKSSIPFLIERFDSLLHFFKRDKISIEQSKTLAVDYKRDERYSEIHGKYITFHRNYRYLIEKFVQLMPVGQECLTKEKFQYLVSLIHELHLMYIASDSLYYDTELIGVIISDDYLFQIKRAPKIDAKEKLFAQEQAKYDLEIIGTNTDRVESPRDVTVFLEELDKAFYTELDFSFRNMMSVCRILSSWPSYNKDVQVNTHYKSTLKEIIEVCGKNISYLKKGETEKIIDLLTLKKENMLKISGQESPCDDLPVWEISKRLHRYNLKPLISIDGFYHWGPYSMQNAEKIWLRRIPSGSLPVLMNRRRIDNVLREEKLLIESSLEIKAYDILKRVTKYVEKRIYLHKRDKEGKHPTDLGDYDVLAFWQQKNIILNIECKDILQVFCLKDAKRQREKIFGVRNDRRYIGRIELRGKYLAENTEKIMNFLKWPFNRTNIPKIISIFVSRYLYWWAVNPPYETNIKFTRIDSLNDFLLNICA